MNDLKDFEDKLRALDPDLKDLLVKMRNLEDIEYHDEKLAEIAHCLVILSATLSTVQELRVFGARIAKEFGLEGKEEKCAQYTGELG